MRRDRVRSLLDEVASGAVAVETALSRLSLEPFEDMGFAAIDHHRALRQGFPEVVFGRGKTPEQVASIAERIAARGDGVLVTRVEDPRALEALAQRLPSIEISELGRAAYLAGAEPAPSGVGTVMLVTAGTADLPVAEEAALTCRAMGDRVERMTDVGVAGIHRLLSQATRLDAARVVIVVAGMDGALPSVVGGLVRGPVIAVPTSVGYGAAFDGVAALLTMLNSCAAGVSVVNIDNGFGAAVAASRITHA